MTAAPPRRRPGRLLAADDGAIALFLSIAALSFLASLILVASVAAGRGAIQWRERLVGSATVVVRAAGLESPDAAAARAAEALGAVAGVARAWPLEATGDDEVIARLVSGKPKGAGPPRLVAVQFKAGAALGAAALSRVLRGDGLDAVADDYRPLTSPVVRAAAVAGLAAAALLIVMTAAVGVAVAFATRRRIAGQWELVELLRLAGAAEGFIGGLFAARAARAAAWAGAAGAVAAALAAAAWRLLGPGGEPFTIAWTDLAAVAPWPLIAAAVGAVAARLSVGAVLRRAP